MASARAPRSLQDVICRHAHPDGNQRQTLPIPAAEGCPCADRVKGTDWTNGNSRGIVAIWLQSLVRTRIDGAGCALTPWSGPWKPARRERRGRGILIVSQVEGDRGTSRRRGPLASATCRGEAVNRAGRSRVRPAPPAPGPGHRPAFAPIPSPASGGVELVTAATHVSPPRASSRRSRRSRWPGIAWRRVSEARRHRAESARVFRETEGIDPWPRHPSRSLSSPM